MTKNSSLIAFLLFTSIATSAQSNLKNFFNSDTEITWLGIDFSEVKLIGDFSQFQGAGEASARDIKNNYFPAWNELIFNERDKYDLSSAFNKSNIRYEIDIIHQINAAAITDDMIVRNPEKIEAEQLKTMVNKYQLDGLSGIGVVFVAEALNKPSNEGVFHIIVLDIESKSILFTEKLSGIPGGFGIRNFWAGSIYKILKEIKKHDYKSWKSKYN